MFISSAVVMPPQSQNPGQNLTNLKNLNKEQRTKNKEQRTKNKEQRTKNKGQRTKDKGQRTKDKEFNFNKALQILIESYNLLNFYTNMALFNSHFYL
ncbi:hypothetical protein J8I88_05470 [Duffyella gerundensis]|uniref:hypothetical protein n=1 Tax=Duffyella gerundensis TaxID=1619313 RepID=UPI001AE2F076|nr:hypothetical protein [Duffyella gerundensis]QTO55313.1 hypothetical protein J8I88_05470 [Duffyella gerundensis]